MQTRAYNKFWQQIHKSAKEKGSLLRVMFELTYRCNFKCRHCYVPESFREKRELKTKEVFSILDQLADIGCFYLGFTGGEPFMRKDIIQILCYAKKKGVEIIIYSNGSLIDEIIARELAQLKPNKVDITLPAMTEAAFEKITCSPGSYKKVFKAIGLLHKNKVNLGFKTCVLKENEAQIEDIQDFAESLGALHRLDTRLSPRLDGSKEPFRYRGSLKNKLQATGYRLQAIRKDNFKECDLVATNQIPDSNNLFKCAVGVSQAAINPFGELKMCLMIDFPKYKILKTSLKDAWQRLKGLVSSIKQDKNYKCDRCNLAPFCKWCPGRAWLYNKTFTSCEPESRIFAKKIKQGLNC